LEVHPGMLTVRGGGGGGTDTRLSRGTCGRGKENLHRKVRKLTTDKLSKARFKRTRRDGEQGRGGKKKKTKKSLVSTGTKIAKLRDSL